jgi:hypothetical protein
MVNLGSTCSWQALTFLLTIEGHKMTMLEIQREYKQEYEGLGDAEREELLHEFKENSDTVKAIRRPSPRGRILDVSNTVRNMMLLVI